VNITISAQGFEISAPLRSHVRARLDAGLGRFDTHIVAVDVFLRDINGPKGGHDKLTRVRVRLRDRHIVAVDSTRSDMYASAALAVRRAKRAVKRALKKQQRVDKQRLATFVDEQEAAGARPN
jgi:ribosomal subunit interface protein